MKNSANQNYMSKMHLSDNTVMQMEPHEQKHHEQFFQSPKDQLVCWGMEANYLDSEFCPILEQASQGSFI